MREIKKGLIQIERLHRESLRSGKAEAEQTLARVHAMLIGLLAEALLRKIVSEPRGFNEREVAAIARQRSQVEKWQLAVELAFRRHYLVLFHEPVAMPAVSKDVAERADKIRALLDGELSTMITERNKVAHAQWKWLLNSGETSFIGAAPPPLPFVALKARSEIIETIGQIVQMLNVSDKTFKRDFDGAYSSIISATANLSGSNQAAYVAMLKQTGRPPLTSS